MLPPTDEDQARARRLLVEANLNRMRRDYQAAESLCRQVLASHSDNPAAWALLGDLCAAQGRADEAAEAYRAALAIEDDPMLRARLEELRRRPPQAAPPAEPAPADRPGRRISAATWGPIAAAVGIAIIAVMVGVLLSRRSEVRASRPAPAAPPYGGVAGTPGYGWGTPAAAPAPPVSSVSGASVRAIPSAEAAPLPETLIPRRSVESTSEDRRVINITKIRSPLTDRERRIVYELSQLRLSDNDPIGNRYCSAMINPGTEHVVITFEVPPGLTNSFNESAMADEAQQLAMAAGQIDKDFATCEVRVITGWTNPRTGARRLDVAFIGQADRPAISEALAAARDNRQPPSIFKSMWWNPNVGG
jgi:hypothetical protein